jgi:hypothetical protein
MNVPRGGKEELHVFLFSISDGDLHASLALAPAEFPQAPVTIVNSLQDIPSLLQILAVLFS